MTLLVKSFVGRVQFGVFEKFTSVYLFQIAQEKSCDYSLIYMKKFRNGEAEESRNQGKITPSIAPFRACS